jgi:hypothetical protein
VKRAVGAVLSRGASWIQGRDGGGDVEIARLSNIKSRSFLQKLKKNMSVWGISVADPECLSRIRIFSIPDPGSEFFPSRIPDPHQEFRYFIPKKWLLSSRKYDSGCSSRTWILTFYPSLIPDPVVKTAPDPGSGSAILVGVCGFSSICRNQSCVYLPVSSWIQNRTMRYFVTFLIIDS